jgi:hypothetical protein
MVRKYNCPANANVISGGLAKNNSHCGQSGGVQYVIRSPSLPLQAWLSLPRSLVDDIFEHRGYGGYLGVGARLAAPDVRQHACHGRPVSADAFPVGGTPCTQYLARLIVAEWWRLFGVQRQ